MLELSEVALARVREVVAAQRGKLPDVIRASLWLDGLVAKMTRRYPPLADLEDEEGRAPTVELAELEGGELAIGDWVAAELVVAAASPYFPLVQEVALGGDRAAVERLMELLDSNLRMRGILHRYGLDPEREYPGVWGKIWEAIPKWDGRDFRAYVARILRNYCLDEVERRKRSPALLDEHEPGDPRPRAQTASRSGQRDALSFVLRVLEELEASGRIKALDGVMFDLISNGRSVADIVFAFRASPVVDRFRAAITRLGGRTDPSAAVVLRYLVDGLAAAEVAQLTGRAQAEVAAVAGHLGRFEDDDERLFARLLSRAGLSTKDLERARALTTNAVNLCLNRIRLKVWMAVLDRTYETLGRRGDVDAVEEALVLHRCDLEPPGGCRMYKDSSCKRERDAADIARRGGLELDAKGVARRLDDLRRKLLEDGLGLSFPDYNACLIERKPDRRKADGDD